jgi:hypothetical protein
MTAAEAKHYKAALDKCRVFDYDFQRVEAYALINLRFFIHPQHVKENFPDDEVVEQNELQYGVKVDPAVPFELYVYKHLLDKMRQFYDSLEPIRVLELSDLPEKVDAKQVSENIAKINDFQVLRFFEWKITAEGKQFVSVVRFRLRERPRQTARMEDKIYDLLQRHWTGQSCALRRRNSSSGVLWTGSGTSACSHHDCFLGFFANYRLIKLQMGASSSSSTIADQIQTKHLQSVVGAIEAELKLHTWWSDEERESYDWDTGHHDHFTITYLHIDDYGQIEGHGSSREEREEECRRIFIEMALDGKLPGVEMSAAEAESIARIVGGFVQCNQ